MKSILLITFVLFWSWSVLSQIPANELERVTFLYSKNHKFKLYNQRFNLSTDNSVLKLSVLNANKFNKKLNRIKFNGKGNKFTLKQINETVVNSLNDNYNNLGFENGSEEYQIPSSSKHFYSKIRFVEGKVVSNFYRWQWIDLINNEPFEFQDTIQFKIRGLLKPKAIFKSFNLPSHNTKGLPAIDPYYCLPVAKRDYSWTHLNTYGLKNFFYIPYNPKKRNIERRSLELYFDKGKSDPIKSSISNIDEFLKTNKKEILQVRIKGYTSLEGDSTYNYQLQKNRAIAVLELLNLKSGKRIVLDTTEFISDTLTFLKHLKIRGVGVGDSSKLTTNQIIQSDSLLKKYESILAYSRKVVVNLDLAEAIPTKDIIVNTLELLHLQLLLPETKKSDAAILGILRYLDNMRINGIISSMDLADIVDNSSSANRLRVLLAFHFFKQIKENPTYISKDESLNEFCKKNGWNELITIAHENLVSLYYETKNELLKIKYTKLLAEIQMLTFEFIKQGILNPEILCEIEYPFKKEFFKFSFNIFSFRFLLGENNGASLSCMPKYELNERQVVDTIFSFKNYLKKLEYENQVFFDEEGFEEYDEETSTDFKNSSYYIFLSNVFNSSKEETQYWTDKTYLPLEFELFNYLKPNVDGFDSYTGDLSFDKSLSLERINGLITTLRSKGQIICQRELNQLLLDYYFKILNYLKHNFKSGFLPHLIWAESGINFIAGYYTKRVKQLDSDLSIYIIKQLIEWNSLPTKIPSSNYSYKLLKKVEIERELSKEEEELLNALKIVYRQDKF